MMRSVMRALSILLAMLLVLSCAGCQQAPAVSSASGAEVSAEEVQTQPSEALPEEASAQEPEPAEAKQPDYPERLFDTGVVHTINVEISEADWQDLRENPLEKTKYRVNVTIDGETVENVSFATKGNSSLGSVASDSNSDRYSFKVNFGKYVKGQTYHGLNKLNLNNTFADATSMKDYICYEIFRAAGVAAPLCSYIWVTVNGKDFGLYLAVEDISEAYLERTTDGRGELYKPETMAFEAEEDLRAVVLPAAGRSREASRPLRRTSCHRRTGPRRIWENLFRRRAASRRCPAASRTGWPWRQLRRRVAYVYGR